MSNKFKMSGITDQVQGLGSEIQNGQLILIAPGPFDDLHDIVSAINGRKAWNQTARLRLGFL